LKKINFSSQEVINIGRNVLSEQDSRCIAFYGDMGSGKTTLIKGMLKVLGAVDQGSSPTFGLVNEYHDDEGNLLAYHFDFYRIQSLEEALDMGLEDYFTSDAYIFMEWPEKVRDLLPEGHTRVHLYFIDENTRRIEY